MHVVPDVEEKDKGLQEWALWNPSFQAVAWDIQSFKDLLILCVNDNLPLSEAEIEAAWKCPNRGDQGGWMCILSVTLTLEAGSDPVCNQQSTQISQSTVFFF